MWRDVALLLVYAVLSAVILTALGSRVGAFPPLGTLLDPLDGLYRTARLADAPAPDHVVLPGLSQPVHIEWDERGVPHIFARNDLDAVRALGYVVAHDRLFQLDFLPRAAAGRLAEALGPAGVPADRFLRRTGMDWGARRNLKRIVEADGEELAILEAYSEGVNAYIADLQHRDLPFELRLLGYEPDPWTPLQSLRLLQYMNYDLTYRTDDPSYTLLRERLGKAAFDLLYSESEGMYVPIVPSSDRRLESRPAREAANGGAGANPIGHAGASRYAAAFEEVRESLQAGGSRPSLLAAAMAPAAAPAGNTSFAPPAILQSSPLLEGFVHGKGSNNWAVAPHRSQTGHAILAGDMHLSVTLPAIWYEVHVVTPTMNSYGVTIPGAPLPVEAFNDQLGWTFTNTGSDQIDHYELTLDPSGTKYHYQGSWLDLEVVQDTIRVRGEEDVVQELRYSHFGPVVQHAGRDVAIRWTANETSRTLAALYAMNRARTEGDFDRALRMWDTPMQNILYADVEGTITIRSTGFLPRRRSGRGDGLLDGSSDEAEWIGRAPFEELPYAANPQHGFLSSTNQRPVDSTYAYYIGPYRRDQYRSLRIDLLLRKKARHGVDDVAGYQSDVHAVQYDLFFPLIDTLSGISHRGDRIRHILRGWDGRMAIDREEPGMFDVFLQELVRLAWDEAVFEPARVDRHGESLEAPVHIPKPAESRLFVLLRDRPSLEWFDIVGTPQREDAAGLLRAALEASVDRLTIGSRAEGLAQGDSTGSGMLDVLGKLRWGRHRKIVFRHLIGSPAFDVLGRGPFEYAGYRETLSPASAPVSTHSASWRVVVDFSTDKPSGRGIYPGGQRGNPFSRLYDLHVPDYLAYAYYELLKPSAPGEVEGERIRATTLIRPADKADQSN